MYSKGYHAQVYKIEDKTTASMWGEAELERHEKSNSEHGANAKLLYYGHKIAHLLFPNNTINVTGARMEEGSTILYSRLSTVPEEHAIYSMHSRVEGKDKVSDCPCEPCTKHRKFHEENVKKQEVLRTAKSMNASGIWVPREDPTDYCKSTEGHIIFFEHEISTYACENSLLYRLSSEQERLQKLIERYNQLMNELRLSQIQI